MQNYTLANGEDIISLNPCNIIGYNFKYLPNASWYWLTKKREEEKKLTEIGYKPKSSTPPKQSKTLSFLMSKLELHYESSN